jgi:hypothetical protein
VGDVFAVTEDVSVGMDGCDAISVFDVRRPEPLFRGVTSWSPGRLAATSDLSLLIAGRAYVGFSGLYGLLRLDDTFRRWTHDFPGTRWASYGGIAVAPGDDALLVADESQVNKYRLVPRGLSKVVGEWLGAAPVGGLAAEVIYSGDGQRAYAVPHNGQVRTIATHDMRVIGGRVSIQVPPGIGRMGPQSFLHAALSPDGRYVVVNTGRSYVSVIDVGAQRVWVLDTPGLNRTAGVAFNSASERPLLAVHGMGRVAIYDFTPVKLVGLGSTPIGPPPVWTDVSHGPIGAIAWTGRGSHLIAATDVGAAGEFRMFEVTEEGQEIRYVRDYVACPRRDPNTPNDIITTNRAWTPTVEASPPASPTVTAGSTPTVQPSDTPGATATATQWPTATATRTPGRLYLPIAIKDPQCNPEQQHADVMLVVDASSSMAGAKLAAAQAAARSFVGLLRLSGQAGAVGDQVGVVGFNQQAWLASGLSGEAERALAAIDGLTTQQGTRIDRGLEVAVEELGGPRRRAGNEAVIVLLTDGIQYEEPESAQLVAAAARGAGIAIYAIGLGGDVDGGYLERVAGQASRYYFAPEEGELEGIYGEIARVMPCPAERFWRERGSAGVP